MNSYSTCNTHTHTHTSITSSTSISIKLWVWMDWVSIQFGSMTEHLLCVLSTEDTGMSYPLQSLNPKGIKTGRHVIIK